MPDLHDTIVRLKCYANTTKNHVVIRRKTIEEAIELLEEQNELLKEQEDLGTELTNAVELIHKKNERIEKLLKEQKAKIEHLKRPDCEHAEHDGTGCLGYCYCGWPQDDEPIEECKRCEKYTGNISDGR